MALDNYRSLFHETNKAQKAEILRKTGLCHKKLGDYETALKFLNDANVQMPESAPVLAEMADCYALCGEERIAKVLFREAFYVDAQKIEQLAYRNNTERWAHKTELTLRRIRYRASVAGVAARRRE